MAGIRSSKRWRAAANHAHPRKSGLAWRLQAAPGMPSVLLVDDEPSLRRLISRWLSRAGFDVTCAENGLVAWQLITKTPFDVILSDIRMPVMTGLELLKKVAAYAPQTPVILMSGSGEIGSKEQAIQNGAFDFRAKPIRLLDLEHAVRAATMGISQVEERVLAGAGAPARQDM